MESSPSEQPTFSSLLSAGSGGSGQLLRGDLGDHTTLQPITPEKLDPKNPGLAFQLLNNLQNLAIGGTKAVGLTSQGDVYGWGEDSEKLGEKMHIHIQPILLLSNHKVTKISCGWAHNICSTQNNQVFVWGEGKFGQLGFGKDQMMYVSKPTPLPIENNNIEIVDVVAGFRQSYIVTNQAKIICFGSNKTLELGQETKDAIISSPITLDLADKGVKSLKKLDAGQRFVVTLDQDGGLYGWGCNKYGQLGQLPEKKKAHPVTKLGISFKISDISCGWNHTLALTDDEQAWITGRGNFGQQGNNKNEDIFGFHLVKLDKEVKLKRIKSGSEAGYVVTEEDKVYVWGWNEHGNLATGDKEDRISPVKLDINLKGKDPQIFCGGAAVIIGLR